MKTYRTPLHRKPKPWRFRKARRLALRTAALRSETRYRKKKRLDAREYRRGVAALYYDRPKRKSSREIWEAEVARRENARHRAALRREQRKAAKKLQP